MHRHGALGADAALWECEALVNLRRGSMSFMNSSGLDDLARRLADSVPESLRAFGRDLESNFKAVLQAQLAKLDLVSRQEFDVQAALLERTQVDAGGHGAAPERDRSQAHAAVVTVVMAQGPVRAAG